MSQRAFRGHALIITVDSNIDPAFNDLGNAVIADGDAVKDTLIDPGRCGYANRNVVRLSGTDASLQVILDTLEQMSSVVEEGDPFFLFYSGHGDVSGGHAYLAPFDANPVRGTGLLTSQLLAEALLKVRSKRKLIAIDACYSGGMDLSSARTKSSKRLGNALLDEMAIGEGIVVIASSRSTETSMILGSDSTSLFTKHLVAGLRGSGGHDEGGFVRVFDLFNYVAVEVRAEWPDQAPVYAAHHQDSNFAVAYCQAVEKRVRPPVLPSAPNQVTNTDALVELFCVLYPLGPADQELWVRAGGDLSRLVLSGTGRTQWVRALKEIDRGLSVTTLDIINVALEGYPKNRSLEMLRLD